MTAITKNYLADIIFRTINRQIDIHRASKKNIFFYEPFPTATDEEIIDFIQSIPYFDLKLKDFLVGNGKEETIIISQNWEIAFLKNVILWAESFEWLHGPRYFLSDAHTYKISKEVVSLSLPY